MLFMSMPEPTGDYHIKMLAGVLVIVMMELLLVATKTTINRPLLDFIYHYTFNNNIFRLKLPMGMKFFKIIKEESVKF